MAPAAHRLGLGLVAGRCGDGALLERGDLRCGDLGAELIDHLCVLPVGPVEQDDCQYGRAKNTRYQYVCHISSLFD
ncbi:hypothetical protein GCM10010389_07720 [Streptomyces echinoruber]|uniref:Uncharacterized protein n=1 Tax=Streptomyces echinoruber TaxID=68898 RepID=A0A918QXC4_9ACTN|nr:hypothetical protein GCM10010389_07720 [Streptomyces echinoruber]